MSDASSLLIAATLQTVGPKAGQAQMPATTSSVV